MLVTRWLDDGALCSAVLLPHQKDVYYGCISTTVEFGAEANFVTTDMEDESPFSKKGLHCVATVTKQFCRFHLHLSSLSFPPTLPVKL